ncbi:NAD-dependent epimerase/dehydratase family protein [Streptacidiphilus sp. N1-3]|uniref:NAD-dependent epimerase/dehydratase family protein n=1 Tax=Streptacidiphilus alkalitolerans TaxID=3342712 RepID=A0ABV6X4S0_9ACTN
MRILLAGGSGTLGQRVRELLTAEGHQVSGLGRGAANELRADLLDRDAVLRAVDGLRFDVVVHAATALAGQSLARHQSMAGTNALRLEGTPHLIEAARATGARRFISESMMFGYGYGDHHGALVTEDSTPFGPRGSNAWLERHVGAMRAKEELTFGTDGIEGVALRFGLFHGAGVTDTTVLPMLRKRSLPVVAEHGMLLSWVSVADAAAAVTAAVRNGRAGRAYNIADDTPVSFGAHVRAVAEAFGAPRPMTVPLWMLRATPLAHTVLSTDLRLSNARARAELDWAPTHASSLDAVRALAAARRPAAVRAA